MIDDVMLELEEKMDKTISVFKDELNGLRAGRANPHLLDGIKVDYYGVPTPLKQVSNVSVPEPRLINIAPWENKMIPVIEKAILQSNIGINPSNDGKIIRLVFPELTEERRKALVKVLHKFAEDSKVAVRNERRHANDQIKKMEKANELTSDDRDDYLKEVQEMTDKHVENIDKITKAKEKEILEI